MEKLKGAIFDLDGVLVDTAKYHYLAWKELANELNIPFTKNDNEKLKGVSRMTSLDLLLSLGENRKQYSLLEKEKLADKKNEIYIHLISDMNETEILPGVQNLLKLLKDKKIKVALGSASKNAPKIMISTGLMTYFDVIIDGNSVSNAKPHPEVFLKGVNGLQLTREECVVFEDAEAGLQAAKAAGCFAIGLGEAENLLSADVIYKNIDQFDSSNYF